MTALRPLAFAVLFSLALSACASEGASSGPEPETPVATPVAADDGEAALDSRPFVLPRSYTYMADGAVLVFSATSDWRHDSGIAGAAAFWARENDAAGRGQYITEDARIFDEDLSKFSVIVLNSPTGDVLSPSQQAAIEAFVTAGGGLVAQHAAGDSSLAASWPWWERQLGTEFVGHPADPQFQAADVVSLATEHPVMAGLGAQFTMTDEWYTFTGVPGGEVVLLAGLDEASYSPQNKVYGVEDLRMGPMPADHPVVWARCPGEGRVVYSALGHKADSYDNADHRRLLKNAFDWVQAVGPGCP